MSVLTEHWFEKFQSLLDLLTSWPAPCNCGAFCVLLVQYYYDAIHTRVSTSREGRAEQSKATCSDNTSVEFDRNIVQNSRENKFKTLSFIHTTKARNFLPSRDDRKRYVLRKKTSSALDFYRHFALLNGPISSQSFAAARSRLGA